MKTEKIRKKKPGTVEQNVRIETKNYSLDHFCFMNIDDLTFRRTVPIFVLK